MSDFNRRDILRVSGVAATPLFAVGGLPANAPETITATRTYKTVHGLDIKADVYHSPGSARQPVLIWIHGGALIMGHRGGMDKLLWYMCRQSGFAIVSIDYRLAPETKLPEIIEDLTDAYDWVREKAPQQFPIDPRRIAVSGGSAGGYLTLMTGFCVEPRPKVLAPFWGYGDIISDWYSKPSPHYNKQTAISKEEALTAVGEDPVAGSSGPNQRWRFYLYCRQQGLWPREVSGRDPNDLQTDGSWFDQYQPLRNVTHDYPPTILVHGQEDTDVPHEQSVWMARELGRAGVEHEFISVPGAGHGLGRLGPAETTDILSKAVAFVKRHL